MNLILVYWASAIIMTLVLFFIYNYDKKTKKIKVKWIITLYIITILTILFLGIRIDILSIILLLVLISTFLMAHIGDGDNYINIVLYLFLCVKDQNVAIFYTFLLIGFMFMMFYKLDKTKQQEIHFSGVLLLSFVISLFLLIFI